MIAHSFQALIINFGSRGCSTFLLRRTTSGMIHKLMKVSAEKLLMRAASDYQRFSNLWLALPSSFFDHLRRWKRKSLITAGNRLMVHQIFFSFFFFILDLRSKEERERKWMMNLGAGRTQPFIGISFTLGTTF